MRDLLDKIAFSDCDDCKLIRLGMAMAAIILSTLNIALLVYLIG